jgi:hypothetical protein
MRWGLLNLCLVSVALIGCGRANNATTKSAPSTNTQPQPPIVVHESGSKEVDALVAKLVSPRPAPYPGGYPVPPNDTNYEKYPDLYRLYATPEVTNAIALLKEKGPAIFPKLIRHLYDDRYSYSNMGPMLPCWENYSVGQVIAYIFWDGEEFHAGYKFRHGPNRTVFSCHSSPIT